MEHSFDVEIATKYGVNSAILLNNIYYWIKKNEANEKHFYDGYYWTYNSVKAFTELFPYLTERQVKTALDKLKDDGIIIKGEYNKSDWDRTSWYAITEKGYKLLNDTSRHNVTIEETLMSSRENTEVSSTIYKQTDSKLNNNSISINRNTEISDKSDFDSHSYSKDDMKEVFLGSIEKKPKKKRISLYDKCVDEVYCYTKNLALQDKLIDYLGLRLNMKDKPIAGVNQWKGILNKLSDVSGESALDKCADKRIKIVNQSIERGWASFFELKEDSDCYRSDSAAFGVPGDRVQCVPTNTTAEERAEILEKQGKRSKF